MSANDAEHLLLLKQIADFSERLKVFSFNQLIVYAHMRVPVRILHLSAKRKDVLHVVGFHFAENERTKKNLNAIGIACVCDSVAL